MAKKTTKKAAAPKPKWADMIFEALIDMNESTGSSQIAIGRWIMANFGHVDEQKVKTYLLRSLKREVEKKTIYKHRNSYKIYAATIKAIEKAEAKKAAAAQAAKKATKKKPAKKKTTKKTTKKKTTKKSTKKKGVKAKKAAKKTTKSTKAKKATKAAKKARGKKKASKRK